MRESYFFFKRLVAQWLQIISTLLILFVQSIFHGDKTVKVSFEQLVLHNAASGSTLPVVKNIPLILSDSDLSETVQFICSMLSPSYQ